MMLLLRAAAFNLVFFTFTPLIALAGTLLRAVGRDRSLACAKLWARVMMAAASRLCGIHVVLTGAEHLPRTGAALLASQHQSAFDTLVWLTLTDLPSYVVKIELTRIPLFGPLLAPAGMIPVDRQAGSAALRGLVRATASAKQAGRQIVIFPEGTRVAPGQHLPLQAGVAAIAARLELPVIPVATDSGLRWGRRAFRKTPGPIHVALGPPIPHSTPRAQLLAAVETFWRTQEARGFEPVDNSVEDFLPSRPDSLNAAPQPS
jgi:1-acyl-sn-glycerol-3-phosphate acyltransferase